jgi:hypothetical protein
VSEGTWDAKETTMKTLKRILKAVWVAFLLCVGQTAAALDELE